MNIKQAHVKSASHFLQHYVAGKSATKLLKLYARSQLALTKREAESFASRIELRLKSEQMNTDQQKDEFFSWYYFNYVSIKRKNRIVSIENVTQVAFFHFIDAKIDVRVVYQAYAIEELELNEALAKEFVERVMQSDSLAQTNEDEKRFWVWYYLNYVDPIEKQD